MTRLVRVACLICLVGCAHRLPPVSPLPAAPPLDLSAPANPSDDSEPAIAPTIAPYDEAIPVAKPIVSMLSAGVGPSVRLGITGDVGTKAPIDLGLDVGLTQGDGERRWPGLVLHAQAETSARAGAIGYRLTVSRVDVHDAPDRAWPALHDDFLTRLAGLSISGGVRADGSLAEFALHRDDTDAATIHLVHELVIPGLLPMWPVLPDEPIAPGAIWQVTLPGPPARRIAYTETITCVLLAATGEQWEIAGTIALSGPNQDIDGSHITDVTGTGTFTFSSSSAHDLFAIGRTDLVLRFNAATPTPLQLHISNQISRGVR